MDTIETVGVDAEQEKWGFLKSLFKN